MIIATSQVTMEWYDVVALAIGCTVMGGFAVAMFGWRRTYRAAVRLMELLDVVGEREHDLQMRQSEWNDKQGRINGPDDR